MSPNVLSLLIGFAMIVSCSTISVFTQKKLFHKYRNKFQPTMEQRMKAEENNNQQ